MSNRAISVVELERRRLLAVAASLSKDLETITAWGQAYAAARKKLGYLFRARKYVLSCNHLTLYEGQIRPGLKYCPHIWRVATLSVSILDAVQRRGIRLIGDTA
nr:unnamed protein product [Callosobruchus chinensis]